MGWPWDQFRTAGGWRDAGGGGSRISSDALSEWLEMHRRVFCSQIFLNFNDIFNDIFLISFWFIWFTWFTWFYYFRCIFIIWPHRYASNVIAWEAQKVGKKRGKSLKIGTIYQSTGDRVDHNLKSLFPIFRPVFATVLDRFIKRISRNQSVSQLGEFRLLNKS